MTLKPDIETLIAAVTSGAGGFLLDLLNVHDAISHQRAIDLMGELMDYTGDDASHPLNPFMDLLTSSIERYERNRQVQAIREGIQDADHHRLYSTEDVLTHLERKPEDTTG